MANDEKSGLFSKVVKFVRNPGGWSEGDAEGGDESSYSKQMLKEMIERKRRNDFVRKREFDMLRKMRRSEVMAGGDPAARPSFFQSSMPSKPDDRASTLKKIDEIEAQMSMQWWKTKHGTEGLRTGSGSYGSSGMPPDSTPRSSSSGGSTTHGTLPRGQGIRPGPVGPYDRTVPQALPGRMPAAAPVVPLAPARP